MNSVTAKGVSDTMGCHTPNIIFSAVLVFRRFTYGFVVEFYLFMTDSSGFVADV